MTHTSNLIKPITIKNLELKHNIFAAPMAGYSDLATRFIALKHGASIAFTEMVSCEGLWREGEKSIAIMRRAKGEEHLAVQLFGGNASSVEKALIWALKENPSLIDFNMACPMAKVLRSNSGSMLMKRLDLASEILSVLKQNVPSHIPFSIKMRLGYDFNNLNYLELAELAFNHGSSMVTMHGRTRSQLYSGQADWQHLKTLKDNFKDKIICGSGDLDSAEKARQMLEQTGVDAVMIARGSIGNPWIYNEIINSEMSNKMANKKTISDLEKIETAKEHYMIALENFNEHYVSHELKKHLLSYLKGIPNINPFKIKFAQANNSSEILDVFKEMETLLY